jgi:hypothetical protein
MSSLSVPPCSSRFYQLRATTPCGVAVYRGYAYNPNGCGGYMYSFYPNPASDVLTVEKVEASKEAEQNLTGEEALEYINASSNKSTRDAKFEIALYDQSGAKRSSVLSSNSKINLDVMNLKAGSYVLKIFDGSRTITKHIEVKK